MFNEEPQDYSKKETIHNTPRHFHWSFSIVNYLSFGVYKPLHSMRDCDEVSIFILCVMHFGEVAYSSFGS